MNELKNACPKSTQNHRNLSKIMEVSYKNDILLFIGYNHNKDSVYCY